MFAANKFLTNMFVIRCWSDQGGVTGLDDRVDEVEALVEYTGGGSDYRMQQGLGGFGTGNAN